MSIIISFKDHIKLQILEKKKGKQSSQFTKQQQQQQKLDIFLYSFIQEFKKEKV